MKVTLKVRFNTSKEKFEKFSSERYLVYVPLEEDQSSPKILANFISKHLGVPMARIEYAGKDINKDWVFEVL